MKRKPGFRLDGRKADECGVVLDRPLDYWERKAGQTVSWCQITGIYDDGRCFHHSEDRRAKAKRALRKQVGANTIEPMSSAEGLERWLRTRTPLQRQVIYIYAGVL